MGVTRFSSSIPAAMAASVQRAEAQTFFSKGSFLCSARGSGIVSGRGIPVSGKVGHPMGLGCCMSMKLAACGGLEGPGEALKEVEEE